MKPKIYIFINGKYTSGDVVPIAVSEDGDVLASHLCSSEGFVAYDMGITGTRKHDTYNSKYPDGWELEYVPCDKVDGHAGIEKAFELNKAKAEAEQTVEA
jgi:hypothetical protein